MTWEIIYHKQVDDDFQSIGPSAAGRVIKAIDKKLTTAPDKYGQPLSNNLKTFRKLRIGDFRVVYKVMAKKILVLVLAVGPRRDKEIYNTASKRI